MDPEEAGSNLKDNEKITHSQPSIRNTQTLDVNEIYAFTLSKPSCPLDSSSFKGLFRKSISIALSGTDPNTAGLLLAPKIIMVYDTTRIF